MYNIIYFNLGESGRSNNDVVIQPVSTLQPFDTITNKQYFKTVFDSSNKMKYAVGSLEIDILEAVNLPICDLNGSSDPYVLVELTGFQNTSLGLREWDPEYRTRGRSQVKCNHHEHLLNLSFSFSLNIIICFLFLFF